MFGKKTGKPQNQIDSLIGANTHVEGNITFSGGLRVDGHVREMSQRRTKAEHLF